MCGSEGNSALHLAFGGVISARAQAVLDAADEAEAITGAAAADVADVSPLAVATCVGRRVLIPRACWPSYACTEYNGRGWAARIIKYSGGVVRLRFLSAATARGIPFQDVTLQLARWRQSNRYKRLGLELFISSSPTTTSR